MNMMMLRYGTLVCTVNTSLHGVVFEPATHSHCLVRRTFQPLINVIKNYSYIAQANSAFRRIGVDKLIEYHADSAGVMA